jgi:heme exporter protein C
MSPLPRLFSRAYWLLTLALFALGVWLVAYHTPYALDPVDGTPMPVQKVFYFHLPVAITAFLACLVVFIASIGYLWQRTAAWDDLAHAAAKVAVLYCSVVLLTGILWGHSAWGVWWTWSPRLVFSLLLWLLYVVYLMIRPSIDSRQRRAVVCAVYGVVALLDVPLVFLSTRLMPDIHPKSVTLAPAMRLTLLYWFLPVLMFAAGLIFSGYRLERRQAQVRQPTAEESGPLHAMQGGVA